MLGFGAVGELALAELPGGAGGSRTRNKIDTDDMRIGRDVELGVFLNDASLLLRGSERIVVPREDRTIIVPGERRRLD